MTSPPVPAHVVRGTKVAAYAVLRYDFREDDSMPPEYDFRVAVDCAVVSVLLDHEEASLECARLNELNRGKHCFYTIQTTRLYPAGRKNDPKEAH